MPLVAFLLARLREPSTYAGIGAVIAAAGINIPASTWTAMVQATIALAGLAAVLIPEGKAPPPAKP